MKKNQHGPILTFYMITFGQRKIWCMALKRLLDEYFLEVLISIIHYYYFIYMYINCDTWCDQNLPHDILIEFLKYLFFT